MKTFNFLMSLSLALIAAHANAASLAHVSKVETFQDKVINSDIPVLLEFYSADCPHCQQDELVISTLVDNIESDFRIVQVEINSDAALQYRNQRHGYPEFFLINPGFKQADTNLGYMPYMDLKKFINDASSTTIDWYRLSADQFSDLKQNDRNFR
jgi:thioredoxin 1